MTQTDPRHSITYDALTGRVTLAFRGDDDVAVVGLDPDRVPGLINALMRARHVAKRDRRPVRAATPGPLARRGGDRRR
jgi:hypothetical protein